MTKPLFKLEYVYMRNGQKLQRLLQFLLGLLLFGGLIALLDTQGGGGNLRELLSLQPAALVAAGFCTVVIVGCIGWRWRSLTRILTDRPVLSWGRACRYFLWNRTLGFLIPKDISDIGGRALLLKTHHGIPLPQAGASVLLDRGFDMLAIVLFLGPAILYQVDVLTSGEAFAIMGVVTLAGYGLLHWAGDGLLVRTISVYNKVAATRFRKRNLKQLDSTLWTARLHKSTLANAFGLSALKIIATGGRFACYALALNMEVSPLLFIVSTPITQLSFFIALTPGGLGVLEATWYGLLSHSGMQSEAIVPFLLTQRLATMMWIILLTSTLEALVWLRKQKTYTNAPCFKPHKPRKKL